MSSPALNVIALISGGKDSFYSLLHCLHNGHRIVALANLFPSPEGGHASQLQIVEPTNDASLKLRSDAAASQEAHSEHDLNSFMYQTVGHEIIPMYAEATGIPLYRQPIVGSAVRHERDYDHATEVLEHGSTNDETESMLPLLRSIMSRHPEANALCAGAILSTYQRTRVESIALRLGLVPLAYLWKYPVLPPPRSAPADEAQLLRDMAVAGLEARIIKVASAGLDERHLWERVTSDAGAERVKRALRKFGADEGAALGEGGEFETIVLDGPASLFEKRIVVPDHGRKLVNEGGGSTWLMLRGAHFAEKDVSKQSEGTVRTPDLLDSGFQEIQMKLSSEVEDFDKEQHQTRPTSSKLLKSPAEMILYGNDSVHWCVLADSPTEATSIEAETIQIVNKIRQSLNSASLEAAQITSTIIVLRQMADFPRVNVEYGKLFTRPNPPSRVTISCGNLLPMGSNIAVYLTVPSRASAKDRDGLHVQSRSYWAPANIGPYSQAITVSIDSPKGPTGLKAVLVAGQIPLIPASMTLPPPSSEATQQQIVLSLQHLWRIGREMRVQLWTGAVVYFARSQTPEAMQRNAKLAAHAWRLAHAPIEEDEQEDNGPDPWDRRYNSEYLSLGSDAHAETALPDWSILTLEQQNDWELSLPPFFAAEVGELPRQSAVEWHGHLGLSQVRESSVEVIHVPELDASRWQASHIVVRASGIFFIHTVISCGLENILGETTAAKIGEESRLVYQESLEAIHLNPNSTTGLPYLAYLDKSKSPSSWAAPNITDTESSFALIPCHSIWSMRGERLGCVALFKTTVQQQGP